MMIDSVTKNIFQRVPAYMWIFTIFRGIFTFSPATRSEIERTNSKLSKKLHALKMWDEMDNFSLSLAIATPHCTYRLPQAENSEIIEWRGRFSIAQLDTEYGKKK